MTVHVVTSVTVQIEAPASFVWDVLVDYERYPEWNPYTIAAETTLELGDRIDLTLPQVDGSDATFINREFIRVVDPPHHLRYDTGEEMQGILGLRDQYIAELGPERCEYYTTDTLSGDLADLVMETTGDWIKAGFDSVALGLKARSEQLYANH
ncbi:MAG: hypothetical protein JWQ70_1355 [Aeromicrobium sp.]|nr:hypothetical protein [Aeromicrobium sp.]